MELDMPHVGTSGNRKLCPIRPLFGYARGGHKRVVASENNIAALRKAAGLSQTQLAEKIGTTLNMLGKLERGGRDLNSKWIGKIAEALHVEQRDLLAGPTSDARPPASKGPVVDDDSEIGMVGVQNIDLPWGLGATFTDQAVQVDVLQFPKVWMEAISPTPAGLLTWARARGDSMGPTIDDGDLILLDRSKRRVDEQDALWAFTVGDTASIKRLRVKGDRFVILSDNPSVPVDEEPIDFVNIVGRVVFVGKRK
ncbi:XRE family transcriptional regulator [Sphingomonas nostoxanthinifaciens]|uniref:XRE family transcriptional regulator n=1 Tax=Sphingomonas nostoxanthinifaciens TaxID=2872652 RepID=UPI001CC20D19|nr:S24 family peptidase [Sphingomonas nostoxanthinifaciens]UAK23644.1 helix-turn-helix domain-containing protein [Sphingomonas nostoxanthinifaciens]